MLVRLLALAAALGSSLLALSAPALADTPSASCLTVQYAFQPDCFRSSVGSACIKSIDKLDLGPQIAVWLQDANGGYVDTLMVTNAVATRGIGNRPGRWDFLSAPFFPYGKRQMALPVWAHVRGKLYDTVMMMEPGDCAVGGPAESCLGWHEAFSSPEPYFCRPLRAAEVNVDAISCPTKFNSEKGLLSKTTAQSYYPPRGDLSSFGGNDSPDAMKYASINDLDAVAAATPPYGAPYNGTWTVPDGLAAGSYALMVEVNKEFDINASHNHPAYEDPNLMGYGMPNNFGQPSVVYRVPIDIGPSSNGATVAVSEIAGYGDWSGQVGDLSPKDSTISTSDPGSGEMRLLERTVGGVTGRVHVTVQPCVCMPPSAVTGLAITDSGLQSTSITLSFTNADAGGAPVPGYEIRYREGTSMTDAEFAEAVKGPQIVPGPPGSSQSVTIDGLKPNTQYVAGMRAVGSCNNDTSAIASLAFVTPAMKFAKVTGCFIATAAWGSELEPHVDAMRRARDRLRAESSLFALAAELYYRSGPVAADVIRKSETARAAVRGLLAPLASVAQGATALDHVRR